MNYQCAAGLEFGGGNVRVDPTVTAGACKARLSISLRSMHVKKLLINTKSCPKAVKLHPLKLMVSAFGPILAGSMSS